MILENLIHALEQEYESKIVPMGFNNPHSYRGYYEDLAFEPAENVTVGEMLKCAKEALGQTFSGYKGGDYTMKKYTTVWLANYGDTGEGIGAILLNYMLGKY